MARNGLSRLADDLMEMLPRKSPLSMFVTGTDTGVGKTHVTCALLRELGRRGIPSVGFKPISCGGRTDPLKFWRMADRKVPLDLINPIHLPRPVAPFSQAVPSWPILLKRIQRAFLKLQGLGYRMILVEGAGGLLCPIQSRHTMRELARELKTPLLLVAHDRLGALNHCLLTLEAAQESGLECSRLVLNRFGRNTLAHDVNGRALKRLSNAFIYHL